MARGRACTRRGKAQSTRSYTDPDSPPSTALHHRTWQREVAPRASHRAEASHAAAAPCASPRPVFQAVTYAVCSGCELLRTAVLSQHSRALSPEAALHPSSLLKQRGLKCN